MLDFDELMVKERIETALREAEQDRAIRSALARPSARFRVGRLVVRLGRLIGGQPALALRDNTGRSNGHGDHC